jgi:SAM-dependent methyltransferase
LVEQLPSPAPWVVGADPDWQSLHEHRVVTLPRTAAFSNRLPFAAGSFDLVVASWLLEHLDRPQQTLAEVSRVLDTGGRFIFITPNGRHPLTYANRLFGRAGRFQRQLVNRAYGRAEGDTFPTRYQANSPATIEALASSSGLTLVRLVAIPDPTYLAFTPALYHLMSAVDDLLPADRQIHLVGVLEK